MSNKQLTFDEVKHIAKLIQLTLSKQELEKYAKQLSQAANYALILQELDLNNTKETSQVTGLKNIYRTDKITPSLTQEEALSNAKHTYNGYFVVPAVISKK